MRVNWSESIKHEIATWMRCVTNSYVTSHLTLVSSLNNKFILTVVINIQLNIHLNFHMWHHCETSPSWCISIKKKTNFFLVIKLNWNFQFAFHTSICIIHALEQRSVWKHFPSHLLSALMCINWRQLSL